MSTPYIWAAPTKDSKLALVWSNSIEESALKQIETIQTHPKLAGDVAIMADAHAGVGTVIGSVIPTDRAIIPAAIGVDIGCGMTAIKLGIGIETIKEEYPNGEFFQSIYDFVQKNIPLGFNHRQEEQLEIIEDLLGSNVFNEVEKLFKETENELNLPRPIINQVGTLGGGNHFIEVQIDELGYIWLMIHSGSRNMGKVIADINIAKAKELGYNAPKDLEYILYDSKEGKECIETMDAAISFAEANRKTMAELITMHILKELCPGSKIITRIDTPHNYVSIEEHYGQNMMIHRKGAIKVGSNFLSIIPGSMGSNSYIVRGNNNKYSYNSASHGAGRVMSRKKAKKTIELSSFEGVMKNVWSKNIDKTHLDEAPQAYKDIEEVMENQKNLVTIVEKLTPIMNIKG